MNRGCYKLYVGNVDDEIWRYCGIFTTYGAALIAGQAKDAELIQIHHQSEEGVIDYVGEIIKVRYKGDVVKCNWIAEGF